MTNGTTSPKASKARATWVRRAFSLFTLSEASGVTFWGNDEATNKLLCEHFLHAMPIVLALMLSDEAVAPANPLNTLKLCLRAWAERDYRIFRMTVAYRLIPACGDITYPSSETPRPCKKAGNVSCFANPKEYAWDRWCIRDSHDLCRECSCYSWVAESLMRLYGRQFYTIIVGGWLPTRRGRLPNSWRWRFQLRDGNGVVSKRLHCGTTG